VQNHLQHTTYDEHAFMVDYKWTSGKKISSTISEIILSDIGSWVISN